MTQTETEKKILKEMIYEILICPKCKRQLTEESMGKRCFNCGEWQYHYQAKRVVILPEQVAQLAQKETQEKVEKLKKDIFYSKSNYIKSANDILKIIDKIFEETK